MNAIASWLSERRRRLSMECASIPVSSMAQWHGENGMLQHRTGKFFSVVGIRAQASDPALDNSHWLLLDQPEIGILGFIFHRLASGCFVLLQAKPEPGNVNLVQMAPSVQDTHSNYTRVHGGKPTPLIEYFIGGAGVILSDSLQSEQGSKFLGKYNRNMTVSAHERFDVSGDYFYWSHVDELKPQLVADFAINTDARSVLASSDWTLLSHPRAPFKHASPNELQAALKNSYGQPDDAKRAMDFLQSVRDASSLSLERIPYDSFEPPAGTGVIALSVITEHREVAAWDQPLLFDQNEQNATLICQERDGALQFLLHARMEVGFKEKCQYAPTAQSGIMNGDMLEYIGAAMDGSAQTLLSCLQSDEGGRFYHCTTRYNIVECHTPITLPAGAPYRWVNLRTLHTLAQQTSATTNELRTMISMLLSEV